MTASRAYAQAATPVQALANPVINGGMDIWQRGTSGFTTSTSYTADRWQFRNDGTAGSMTISRQTTSDTTNLPFIQYGLRVQRNNGSTSTGAVYLAQSLETVNSLPLAGKAITLSFYARKGANYSASTNNLSVVIARGTGTDQNILVSYTGEASVASTTVTLTDTWTRYVVTGSVASTATELAVYFGFTPTGTAGANDWYEITGVQIDVGTYTASTAPAFRRSGNTIAGELAACQRYYWRSTQNANIALAGFGTATTTTKATIFVPFPTVMRVTPTSLEYSSIYAADTGSAFTNISSVVLENTSNFLAQVALNLSSGTFTQYRPITIQALNNGGYIGFSSEL